MSKILSLQAIEILDSRGTPTIEVLLQTDTGILVKSKVPSGASTGEHEALELRDKDPKRYFGKGVRKACENVNTHLFPLLKGKSVVDQEALDMEMIRADGTENKSRFGANAILGVSMAIAMAGAAEKKLPLYRYLGKEKANLLPCPMMNIINGGAHADSSLDIQEFMIRPFGFSSFSEALRAGVEVFYSLKGLLKKEGFSISVGDEGGFAPKFSSEEEALQFIIKAIETAGYSPGKEISLALDAAASDFYVKETHKYIEKKKKMQKKAYAEKTSLEQIAYLQKLTENFPIDSIEDGLDENDWAGWKLLTEKLGKKIQIVGDDLFVTNPKFLQRGIQEKVANAILIKLNQIGTVTETIQTILLAQKSGYKTVVSHRSGETEDTFIADLAVAMQCGQIKTGSLSRSDRIAKYNRLLEIENELGREARFGKL
ncbi:MAG: phosphopyruvate hydratase [Chlamydiota bacterium]